MSETAALLRSTTEEMANHASVDMELWQRHSIVALRAADELNAALLKLHTCVEALEIIRDWPESKTNPAECAREALAEVLK
jgi:hypothetical protein